MILFVLLQVLLILGVRAEPPFNNPHGVDIWCGKAYRATDPSFDPGGEIVPPLPWDNLSKLDLLVTARHTIYLSTETSGYLLFSTLVSNLRGQLFKNATWYSDDPSTEKPFTELSVLIRERSTNKVIVKYGDIWVPVNVTDYEVPINLSLLTPSRNEIFLEVIANSPDAIQTYQGGARFTYLPDRNDTGSVARVDSLYGGLEVKSNILTKGSWKSIFPYSFYVRWDWTSETLYNSSSPTNISTFRALGYNLIHPVPPGGFDSFNATIFEKFLTLCDELELYVMYDMRATYQDHDSISAQLKRLQRHPSLLLYYTADEPDGWCDPLNATALAYNHIKSIDPYHPVSLVLNCANFYFEEYTAGADIILEDTYPIAVNTSFSTVYHTPCNSSYGDCGCDNCHVGDSEYPLEYTKNRFLDIIDRTDNMYQYQDWQRNRGMKKPVWGVPQGFWDNGSFWDRWPTAAEEAVQGVLRINHGAKGIVAWLYPTSPEIENVTSSLAKLLTSQDVTKFTLGSKRIPLYVVGGDDLVDAAAWIRDGEMLLSIVYMGYKSYPGRVAVRLPKLPKLDVDTLFGVQGWWTEGKEWLFKDAVEALEVTILSMGVL